VASSGTWYFKAPPAGEEHDSEDEDYREPEWGSEEWRWQNYCLEVEPDMMEPLVASLAKAVRKMPVLENFLIKWNLNETCIRISYFGPGWRATRTRSEPDVNARRIYYEVDDWWPSSEVMQGPRCAS
jgi:hypothetical protein